GRHDMAALGEFLDQGAAQYHKVDSLSGQQPLAHGADGTECPVDPVARLSFECRADTLDQSVRCATAQDAEGLHCFLAPDFSTPLAHFSISRRRKASNSAGVMTIGTAPCLAHASLIAGLAMILAISPLRRSTISLGVPVGAMMPSQIVAS